VFKKTLLHQKTGFASGNSSAKANRDDRRQTFGKVKFGRKTTEIRGQKKPRGGREAGWETGEQELRDRKLGEEEEGEIASHFNDSTKKLVRPFTVGGGGPKKSATQTKRGGGTTRTL